ncbi:MAG: hypothetical protein CFE21_08470 [Bacteroidetes bacterium B1(2017)]|nr:MAG: hypothetical protein CFE21_08470 [Bacteroidetes bacterium B1(2017)]
MKISELPFNKLIELYDTSSEEYLLFLEDSPHYTNHIGTVHAAALFSLAEATCAQFLLSNFTGYSAGLIPILRKVEVKYKKPAVGKIGSTASLIGDTIETINEQLESRKRALLKLKIDLYDPNKVNVMSGEFEWFVSELELTKTR